MDCARQRRPGGADVGAAARSAHARLRGVRARQRGRGPMRARTLSSLRRHRSSAARRLAPARARPPAAPTASAPRVGAPVARSLHRSRVEGKEWPAFAARLVQGRRRRPASPAGRRCHLGRGRSARQLVVADPRSPSGQRGARPGRGFSRAPASSRLRCALPALSKTTYKPQVRQRPLAKRGVGGLHKIGQNRGAFARMDGSDRPKPVIAATVIGVNASGPMRSAKLAFPM